MSKVEKDILFYQANFEPEVCRMLDALEKNDIKYFPVFQEKTLKIINEIIQLSGNWVEKEEWLAVKEMVEAVEDTTKEMKNLLRNFGHPFALKFLQKHF